MEVADVLRLRKMIREDSASISKIDDETLCQVASRQVCPAYPSQALDWGEREAIPLIHALAARLRIADSDESVTASWAIEVFDGTSIELGEAYVLEITTDRDPVEFAFREIGSQRRTEVSFQSRRALLSLRNSAKRASVEQTDAGK